MHKSLLTLLLAVVTVMAAQAQKKLPYYEDFNTQAAFDTYTIIDVAGDECTWEYNDGANDRYAWCRFNGRNAKDDWFISPEFALHADRSYILSFVSYGHNSDWPEHLEVKLGQGVTVEAMTQEVMPRTKMTAQEGTTYQFSFTVPADGNYNIGFHACSVRDMHMLHLDKISLKEGELVEPDYSDNDMPAAPVNVQLREKGGKLTLTWEAPTEGAHGGTLADTSIKYRLADNNGLVKEVVSQTTVSFEGYTFDKQTLTYFTLTPINSVGEGTQATSNYILVGGEPFLLPISESFDNAPATSIYWNYINYWHFYGYSGGTLPGYQPQDGSSFIYNVPTEEGEESLFFSGNISLAGSKEPALEFYYYNQPESKSEMRAVVSVETGAWETAQELPFDATAPAGWVKASVPLTKYLDARYIQVGIATVGAADRLPFLIDNIKIHDVLGYNLAIGNIVAPISAYTGADVETRVSVSNVGLLPAADYSVELLRDGQLVATAEGTPLEVGESREYFLVDRIGADQIGKHSYQARVNYPDDANTGNNTTANAAEVSIDATYDYPVPESLACQYDGTECKIMWDEVDTTAPLGLFDDFESYATFTIDHIGPWEVYDKDKAETYWLRTANYPMGCPHSGEPMAWQVTNLPMFGFTPEFVKDNPGYAGYSPISGNQVLASYIPGDGRTKCDDWLISPELSGNAQTVSLWLVSPSGFEYGCETYEVWTSTTDRNISSFTEQLVKDATAPTTWTEITVSLPAGTKYFALRHVSNKDTYMMMVDDVIYEAPAPRLVGYNVYVDGKLTNAEPLAAPAITLPTADVKAFTVQVTAVYDAAESALSEPLSVDLEGIREVLSGTQTLHAAYQLNQFIRIEDGKKILIRQEAE